MTDDVPQFEYEQTQFWMVWTKNGMKPKFVHETLASATTEAARLAEMSRGQKFIVLEAVVKVSCGLKPKHLTRRPS